jgi:hypothetical protein
MIPELRQAVARIIHTGDVPLGFRNAYPDGGDIAAKALQARASGDYRGLSLEQIEARLEENRAAADEA